MTKQQKIREETAQIIKKETERYDNAYWSAADLIMKYQHSQGVVLKVDKKINGNLVNNLWDAMQPVDLDECRLLVKQALEGAGYYTVESLIGS